MWLPQGKTLGGRKNTTKNESLPSSFIYVVFAVGKTPGGRKNKEHYGQRRTLRTTGSDPQLTTNFW